MEVNGESRNQETPGEKKDFNLCKVQVTYFDMNLWYKARNSNHMMSDLERWIKNETPNECTVYIFTRNARWHWYITYILSNLHKTMMKRRSKAKAFLTRLLRGVLAIRLRIKVYIHGTFMSRTQINKVILSNHYCKDATLGTPAMAKFRSPLFLSFIHFYTADCLLLTSVHCYFTDTASELGEHQRFWRHSHMHQPEHWNMQP